MLSPVRSLILGLVLGALACDSKSEPVTRATIVGCYDLQWAYTRLADTSSFLKSILPHTLTLDTNGLVGTVEPKVVGNWSDSSYWEMKNGRSVIVFWSSGFAALGLDLRSRGDTLFGDARLYHDAGGDYRIGRLRASPAACSRNAS